MIHETNSPLVNIRKSFKYMDKELVSKLFTSYYGPKLEYASLVWSTNSAQTGDKEYPEGNKTIPELRQLSYDEKFVYH